MGHHSGTGIGTGIAGIGLGAGIYVLESLGVSLPTELLIPLGALALLLVLGGVVLEVRTVKSRDSVRRPSASQVAGDQSVNVRSEGGVRINYGPQSRRPAQPDPSDLLKVALHALTDEVQTMRGYCEKAQADGFYVHYFYLPNVEWSLHRNTLSRRVSMALRRQIADIYVATDRLNGEVARRDEDGSSVLDDDDLPGLIQSMKAAEEALGNELARL